MTPVPTNWERTGLFSGHRGGVYALAPDAEAHSFLSTGSDGRVVRWDLRSPDAGLQLAAVSAPVFSMHHDRERGWLFLGDGNGGLHLIDLRARAELHLVKAHQQGIFHIVAIGPTRIACAAGDGALSIWRLPSLEMERLIPLSDAKLRCLAPSPDGAWLAVAGLDGTVRVLDTEALNEHWTLHAHERGAASVQWHPRKSVLLSGGRDGHLRLWRAEAGFPALHALPAHRASIYAITFSHDGRLCATAGPDSTVMLWDAMSFDPVLRMKRHGRGHSHSVNCLLWTGDGTLLSGSDDRTIRAWRPFRTGGTPE